MVQIFDQRSNKLGSGGCPSRAKANSWRLLSNENEEVSFEKVFTFESEGNNERDKTANKTKKEINRNLRFKNPPETTLTIRREVKEQS